MACRNAGLPVLSDSPKLHLPAGYRPPAPARVPPDTVILHTRSNQAQRDWQAARWHELARALLAAGRPVAEVGLVPSLGGVPGVLDLCGRLDVPATAAAISQAALFVGIDSGPAHLAHAVGTPGVILLGLYGPYARYMPYSGRYADGTLATVLQYHAPASELPVQTVLAAVNERLARPRPPHAATGERRHPDLQPS